MGLDPAGEDGERTGFSQEGRVVELRLEHEALAASDDQGVGPGAAFLAMDHDPVRAVGGPRVAGPVVEGLAVG